MPSDEKILRGLLCETEGKLRKTSLELEQLRIELKEAQTGRAKALETVKCLQSELDRERARVDEGESLVRRFAAERKSLQQQLRNLELALEHAEATINRGTAAKL